MEGGKEVRTVLYKCECWTVVRLGFQVIEETEEGVGGVCTETTGEDIYR